jgi:hypothetical protein
MSIKKRFLQHLEAKGAIPKGYACGGKAYAMGGMVHDNDEWQDSDWNDHEDTSGEPMTYGEKYMEEGYAFGGKIKAPEHGDEGHPEMSEEEVKKHLAQSLMRRKQNPGIRR